MIDLLPKPATFKKAMAKLAGIFLILTILANFQAFVQAEGLGGLLVSSSSKVELGKTIVITFKASDAISLDNYQTEIAFDSGKFQYVAGSAKNLTTLAGGWDPNVSSNKILVGTFGATQSNVSKLCQLSFKAIAKGTATFSAANSVINDQYPANYSINVTVIDPLPSNNNLKSLDVDPGSLSPAFSAGQTSYAVAVAEGISKLTVSATPADSLAKVAVSGNTNLQDGDNKITVVVTAQNGSKKTYTITATRAGPTPTPEPSPSPAPSPTPALSVNTLDGPYDIVDLPAEVPIPQGFYRTVSSVSDRMVTSFKALKGDLTLFYLSNQAGDSGFFYFDSQSQTYMPFTVLNLPAQAFSAVSPESGVTVPAGFQDANLSLDGQMVKAWQRTENSAQTANQYLLYLMDSKGDAAFYLYDQTRQLLFLYSEGQPNLPTGSSTNETITPTPGADENSSGTAFNPWQLVALLLGLLCLVLLGLLIWLFVQYRGGGPSSGGPSDYGGDPLPPLPKAPPIRRVD